MKQVFKSVLCVVALAVCANALEFKKVQLPPVDGSIVVNGVWVTK